MLEIKIGKTNHLKSEKTYHDLNEKHALNIFLDAHKELEKYYDNGIVLDISDFNPFQDKVTLKEFRVLHYGYLKDNTVLERKIKEVLRDYLNNSFQQHPIDFMLRYHPKYTQKLFNDSMIKRLIERFKTNQSQNEHIVDVKNAILNKLDEKIKEEKKEIWFKEKVSQLYSKDNLFEFVIENEPLVDEKIIAEAINRLGSSWEIHENQYYDMFINNDDYFHQTFWNKKIMGPELLKEKIHNEIFIKHNIRTHIQSFLINEHKKPINVFVTNEKSLSLAQIRAVFYWIIYQITNKINQMITEELENIYIYQQVFEKVRLSDEEIHTIKVNPKNYINFAITYIANNFFRGNLKEVWDYWNLERTNMYFNLYEFDKIPKFIRDKIDIWKIYESKSKQEFETINDFFEGKKLAYKIPDLYYLSQQTGFIVRKEDFNLH